MKLRHFTTGLVVLLGLFVVWFGTGFLINPEGSAAGFGIPEWPHGNAAGYFVIKAVRDLVCAIIIFILLALRQRRALGWVLLADAIIPFVDAANVVTHGGTLAAALGIHAATGVVVIVAAVLLLRERPLPDTTATKQDPAQPAMR
ncbi:DUF4267 domain-containing protein [Saccharopolyspora sp. 5N708]|uniref:DUF4267 domain-containing protein n=1 Tax=Saccharopolyspora sp. 5N708 TaxID=3457424 RepID=UPI003FD2848C